MGNVELRSVASGRVGVLYLAGIPRTGSTVLGHALATIPGVLFAGELNFFWRRFAQQEICSCGAALPECPLWSAVVGKAFPNMTLDKAQALSDLEDRVVGKQRVFALSPMRWPRDRNRDVRQVLTARDDFYRSLAEISNVSWIVDGGKEPVFGRVMTRLSRADFYTVHLVRDPRGVAFSWMKRIRSDSEPRDMPVRLPVTSALEWVLQNLMVHVGLQRRSRSYIRVRYEDLVADPIGLVSAIADAIGLTGSVRPAASTGELGMSESHLVAGNPGVRRQAAKTIKLSLDDAWRVDLPRTKQWLVTVICSLLMSRYGYPLRSGARLPQVVAAQATGSSRTRPDK